MKAKGKILSLLLALCMVLTLMPTVVFAEGATDSGYNVEDEVIISFTIKDNPGFNGISAYINADWNVLKLEKIERGDLIPNGATFTSDKDNKSILCTGPGRNITEDGVLFTAKFKITGEPVPGKTYPVTVQVLDATRENESGASVPVSITITGGSIKIAGGSPEIETGSVKIQKFVVGDLAPEENGEELPYSFMLKLLDDDGNAKAGTARVSGSEVTITAEGYPFVLSKGGEITFTDIPVGTDIKVEEISTGEFTTDVMVAGRETKRDTKSYVYKIEKRDTPKAIQFDNNYGDKTGSLTVSKTVSGGGADTAKKFNFNVWVYNGDAPLEGTYGNMIFDEDGKATFTLTDGQSVKATGLLVGYSYYVEETDNDGYTVTAKVDGEDYIEGAALTKEMGVEGTIESDNLDVTVAFNNYKAGGSTVITHTYPLTLSKQVSGLASVPADYAVTLNITNKYGTVVRTLTLGADESKTVYLPYGEYTISETAAEVDGYTLSSQEFSDNAFVLSSSGKSVNITNTYTELKDESTEPSQDENGDDADKSAPAGEAKDDTGISAAAGDDDADENVPKTGDKNDLLIWIAILLAAGSVLAIYRQKTKKMRD